MAALDLPAVADYIAKQTASSSLAYVGHSQGTTAGLAALASKEAFAARVRGWCLLQDLSQAVHLFHS